MMFRFISVALLFGLLVSPTIAMDDPDIRGKITKVQPARTEDKERMVGMVMVKSDVKEAKVDKANLIVTSKTRIFKVQGEERVQATFEDLRIGATVAARFVKGPTIMIYPLQVAASEILIIHSEEAK